MAHVFPFRAYWLDPVRINQQDYLAPVSDFISEQTQKRRLTNSRWGIINRLALDAPEDQQGKGLNFQTLDAVMADHIHSKKIKHDQQPSIYEIETEFYESGSSEKKTRKGLVVLMRLDDEAKIVYPHEETFQDAVHERCEMFQQCAYQFDPVFMIYPGDYKKDLMILESDKRRMFEVTTGDKITHKLYRISESNVIRKLVSYLNEKIYIIADGHHRYEGAVLAGAKSLLVYLVGSENNDLTILPSHRLLKLRPGGKQRLDEVISEFYESVEVDYEELLRYPYNLSVSIRKTGFLGSFDGDMSRLLKSCWSSRMPDIQVFEKQILEKLRQEALISEVHYTESSDDALEMVSKGQYDHCILLNPISMTQIWETVKEGKRMPQKTTSFLPKILSALLVYRSL